MKQDKVYQSASLFFKAMYILAIVCLVGMALWRGPLIRKASEPISEYAMYTTNWVALEFLIFGLFKLLIWAMIYDKTSKLLQSFVSSATQSSITMRNSWINQIALLLVLSYFGDLANLFFLTTFSKYTFATLISGTAGGNGILNMLVPSTTGSSSLILAIALKFLARILRDKESIESEIKLTI